MFFFITDTGLFISRGSNIHFPLFPLSLISQTHEAGSCTHSSTQALHTSEHHCLPAKRDSKKNVQVKSLANNINNVLWVKYYHGIHDEHSWPGDPSKVMALPLSSQTDPLQTHHRAENAVFHHPTANLLSKRVLGLRKWCLHGI